MAKWSPAPPAAAAAAPPPAACYDGANNQVRPTQFNKGSKRTNWISNFSAACTTL